MTEAVGQALEQALAYHRAPGRLSAAQGRPLPEGVLTLLRLAGGDQALAAQCAQSSGESESDVVAAAVFFIQQVMFAGTSDSYRVLGVNPDAPDARIKEHYRWLVRWLHPDRNTDEWDSIYADRVNAAWQTLRLPDRRRDYDQGLAQGPADDFGDADAGYAIARVAAGRPARAPAPETALLSGRTVQRLPVIVLGGLGGLAVTLLFLMWLARDEGRAPTPVIASTALPAEAQAVVLANAEPPPASEAAAVAPEPAPPAAAAVPAALPAAVQRPLPAPATPVASIPAKPVEVPLAAPGPVAAKAAPVVAKAPPAVAAARPMVARAPAAAAPVRQPAPAPVVPRPAPAPAGKAPAPTPDVLAVRTAPPVPAAATAAAPAAITEPQARLLLGRFSQAYGRGDINGLMRLFAADARNNRGGRDAIVYDYQSLFSSTQARELRLTPSGWMPREGGATLLANYEASVQLAGRENATVTQGEIRFDLRLEDGEPRISVVRHDAGR